VSVRLGVDGALVDGRGLWRGVPGWAVPRVAVGTSVVEEGTGCGSCAARTCDVGGSVWLLTLQTILIHNDDDGDDNDDDDDEGC